MDLIPARDVSPAAWLDVLWPWRGEVGTRAGSVVPEGYEAYARVFHPAWEQVGDSYRKMRWADVAAKHGTVAHPLMQWGAIHDAGGGTLGDWLGDGNLEADSCRALSSILEQFTTTPDRCWFGLWSGYGDLPPFQAPTFTPRACAGTGREYFLFLGRVDDAADFELRRGPRTPTSHHSPNLWWPEDRSWCVAIEIDFDSTLVGASREAIDAILASEELEAMPVPLGGRLDIGGDEINPARFEP